MARSSSAEDAVTCCDLRHPTLGVKVMSVKKQRSASALRDQHRCHADLPGGLQQQQHRVGDRDRPGQPPGQLQQLRPPQLGHRRARQPHSVHHPARPGAPRPSSAWERLVLEQRAKPGFSIRPVSQPHSPAWLLTQPCIAERPSPMRCGMLNHLLRHAVRHA